MFQDAGPEVLKAQTKYVSMGRAVDGCPIVAAEHQQHSDAMLFIEKKMTQCYL